MCDLTRKSKHDKIKGWKVVAEKDGKYYSLAMGFRYQSGKPVPVVKRQRVLCVSFDPNMLEHEGAYREQMLGRTAIFFSKTGAEVLAFNILGNELANEFRGPSAKLLYPGQTRSTGKDKYNVDVVFAEVSGDVMEGTYASYKVAAGRKITFLEED